MANDVRYFEIEDQGQVVGGFYFDLYARNGKRGGAWMSGFHSRVQTANGLQNQFAIWCVTLPHRLAINLRYSPTMKSLLCSMNLDMPLHHVDRSR